MGFAPQPMQGERWTKFENKGERKSEIYMEIENSVCLDRAHILNIDNGTMPKRKVLKKTKQVYSG